jgi:amino acid adenylation domain-containing protein
MTWETRRSGRNGARLLHAARPDDQHDAGAWRIEQTFSEGVRRWPERPAVETAISTLTYAELERGSNRLAARLADEGVARKDLVGLACDDVSQFALGALAILKVGAAYVSLDLRHPLQRAPNALFEGAARLLIGGGERLSRHRRASRVPVMGDAFEDLAGPDPGPPPRAASDRDPAYVCFTSGTSGEPKAAVIPHEGVRGLVRHPEFDVLRPGARIASCSTLAFDAITFEVWGALLNGGCLIEVPLPVVSSPTRLADFLAAARIDGAFLTTSLFNAVATLRPEAFGVMECLVIGGEAVDPAYVRRVFASGRPPGRLVNGYGPTETTTFATAHVIEPADLEPGIVPIGRPIEGRSAWVLSPEGNPVRFGEEGELCISGPAVALGYLDAPELTSEKFVPAVAAAVPGARMYRTGDLCRRRPDGALEYLGRLDEQVKVRGYRIEPAGVAALLRRIDGVEDAVVLSRPGPFGAKQLVGALRGDRRLSEGELLAAARTLMPDYMVPSAVGWVDGFPLKPNGKLDADALLATIEEQGASPEEEGLLNAVEAQLVQICRKNGGRADFHLDTPLEEICDSLAVVGVLLDIEAAFDVQLPLWALSSPVTIRSMAAALKAPAHAPGERVNAFYVSQPWNMNRAPPEIGRSLTPAGRWSHLQVPPRDGSGGAYDSVEAMGEILERQVLEASDGGPSVFCGHSFGGVLAFELARRMERRGAPVARVVLIDSRLVRARAMLDRFYVRSRHMLTDICSHPVGWSARLTRRVRASVAADASAPADEIRRRCVRALASYRPDPVSAPAVLLRCTRYDDAVERPENNVWGLERPWAPLFSSLDVIDFSCSHKQIVEDPVWISKIAAAVRTTRAT